jgi:hypothetical protein
MRFRWMNQARRAEARMELREFAAWGSCASCSEIRMLTHTLREKLYCRSCASIFDEAQRFRRNTVV